MGMASMCCHNLHRRLRPLRPLRPLQTRLSTGRAHRCARTDLCALWSTLAHHAHAPLLLRTKPRHRTHQALRGNPDYVDTLGLDLAGKGVEGMDLIMLGQLLRCNKVGGVLCSR